MINNDLFFSFRPRLPNKKASVVFFFSGVNYSSLQKGNINLYIRYFCNLITGFFSGIFRMKRMDINSSKGWFSPKS